MECSIKDPEFRVELEPILDVLAQLYSLSKEKFVKAFKQMPEKLRTELANVYATKREIYDDTELEDIADYIREVFYYYFSSSNKIAPEVEEPKPVAKVYKPFTLRNPNDLKEFEEFLDLMCRLLDLSPGHFIELLPKCPVAYWDKIDDLRETSYKPQRDSEEYLRCLEKCKKISYAYSELTDNLFNAYDE